MEKILKKFPAMKSLLICAAVLLLIVLICCRRPAVYDTILPVPYVQEKAMGWNSGACVQMWSQYDGYNYAQEQIVSVTRTGIYPRGIAMAVGMFTREVGLDYYFDPKKDNKQQDLAMSAQAASIINDGIPTISIVCKGTQSFLVIGFRWKRENNRPTIYGIWYHDPAWNGYPSIYVTPEDWKARWFQLFNGYYVIILGYHWYIQEGEAGYEEFLAEGGTYYGGPENYDPNNPELPLAY